MPAVPAEVGKKRLQLKRELFNLLLQHSDGILNINVWGLLAENSKMKLTNSEFRIGSMDGAFKLFEDMIHEEHRDRKTFICLNQQFSWESNIPLQNRGLETRIFGNSSQQSPGFKKEKIRVKPSYLEKKGVGQNLDRQHSASSSSTETPSRQGQQVIDLTGENVIDLTADSSFISLDLDTSASSQRNAARRDDGNFISLEMNSPAPSTSSYQVKPKGHRDKSLEDGRRSQQGRQQHHYTDVLPNAPAPYESLHANATPLNKKKFEEKELNVAPVRRTNRYTRPTKDQIDNVAQECIEILAESNCYVSSERIEKLLLQRFQARSLCDIGPRYIDQIGCVNEHNRLIAKVNAHIQAFVKVRCICTLHELKDCLKEYAVAKDNFSKLNIGPLQRLPIVYDMFKFPTDFEEIPEITTLDILEHLRNYLTKKNKWTERIDLQDFMEYLVEEYDADDAFQLGVRIRSLALGVQVCYSIISLL